MVAGECRPIFNAHLMLLFMCGVVAFAVNPSTGALSLPSAAAQIAEYQPMWGITLQDREAVREVFSEEGIARFEFERSFQQVGFRIDATHLDGFAARSLNGDGKWSAWQAVDIYFREGVIYNGLFLPHEPTRAIEVRGGEAIEFARIEFSEQVRARQPLIRRYEPTNPVEPAEPAYPGELDPSTMIQGRAPAEMVTSRHEWRAIDPDKICNNVVIPNRMTFHHTAGSNSDADPHARMRSTQSYHINDRGWCDIGYHFIVARNGEILQGRSRANRPGAHVEGQNDGNLGVGIFGNYVSVEPPEQVLDSVARIYHWVHETYGVPLSREVIKGHREWPGTATECPGNMGLPKLDVIVERANDLARGLPPIEVGLGLSVEGLDDFYRSQSSAEILDALEGDEFQIEITIMNDSQAALESVEFALEFGEPAFELLRITLDGDELEIPEVGQALNIGTLPRASTSVLALKFVARRYNLGEVEPGTVNIWVKNIDGLYKQDVFGERPALNLLGGRALEAQVSIDILSRREWHFDGEAADDFEGWTATGEPAVAAFFVKTDVGALTQILAHQGGGLLAPEWTTIDADRMDEFVLRLRSYDGPHVVALQWAAEGEGFDASRQVRFQAPGDGEFHTLVVPLADHPHWSGEVRRLHLTLLDELWSESRFVGRYEVDQIYFQSQERGIVGSETLELAEIEPAAMVHRGLIGPRLGYDAGEGPLVGSNMGCRTSGGEMPAGLGLFLGALLLFRARRRCFSRDQLAA